MLSPQTLSTIDKILLHHAEHGYFNIEAALKQLVNCQFASARYYEVLTDVSDGHNEHLILSAYAHKEKNFVYPESYKIPIVKSTLGLTGNFKEVAVGSFDLPETFDRAWLGDLSLERSSWIDLPIIDDDSTLMGTLCVSWNGLPELVSPDSQHLLSMAGKIISRAHGIATKRSISKIEHSLENSNILDITNDKEPHVLENLIEMLRSSINAKSGAIFRYSWPRDSLEKVCESFSNTGTKSDAPLAEIYASGHCLTGMAWTYPEFRQIPDFQSLSRSRESLINQKSLCYHEEKTGMVRTLLYEVVGNNSAKFFVRFMNRQDKDNLPFTKFHQTVLSHACRRITEQVEEATITNAISVFRRFAWNSMKNITDLDSIIDDAFLILNSIGLNDVILIHANLNGERARIVCFQNDEMQSRFTADYYDVSGGSLFSVFTKKTGVSFSNFKHEGLRKDDKIVELFKEMGFSYCVAFGVTTDQSQCLIVSPQQCELPNRSRGAHDLISSIDNETLASVASVLSGCIDASTSHVSAENAENLVAQIGHEITSPLASLGQIGIACLVNAEKEVRDILDPESSICKTLRNDRRRIDAYSDFIRKQLDVAVALAEKSRGSIQCNFEEFSWDRCVQESWLDARNWASRDQHRQSSGHVVLEVNEALKKMHGIGDESLIKAMLANLFKNAIKYSLPRHRGKPMVVKVHGIPQSHWHILQVSNWGIGIPPEKKEEIFQRFYRIHRTDKIRPIKGMGLGLYLARFYAKAHSGDLFCKRSDFVLDDEQKMSDLQGFETTFEVRIPTINEKGIKRIEVGEMR